MRGWELCLSLPLVAWALRRRLATTLVVPTTSATSASSAASSSAASSSAASSSAASSSAASSSAASSSAASSLAASSLAASSLAASSSESLFDLGSVLRLRERETDMEGFRFPMTFIPEHLGGGILWNASVALLNYFNTKLPPGYFKGKRVLELGAGVGYVGLYLASSLGAHVTCTEHPQAMAVLRANVASSARKQGGQQRPEGAWVFPSGGSVQCEALAWGEEDWESSPISTAAQGAFDAVISCELYFDDNLHEPLVWTVERVLRQSPKAEVWSIFLQRDFSLMFFALLSDLGTVKVEVISDVDDLSLESLLMHKFTYAGESSCV